MEEGLDRVVSLPTEAGLAEERMLGADLVREMVARKERRRRGQADRAGTWGGSQDGQALAQTRQLAATANWASVPVDRAVHRVHRAARPGGGVERRGLAPLDRRRLPAPARAAARG